MKRAFLGRSITQFLITSLIFLSSSESLRAEPSSSDRYCSYLQTLQAKVYQDTQKPGPIDNLIRFVNSLMQKVSLEALEKDAIQQKMSFEEFQQWANDKHSMKISDHYKPQYLNRYINEVCGEITNSATFGAEREPEMSATAEKQFDPAGHPYLNEVPSLPNEKKENTPIQK